MYQLIQTLEPVQYPLDEVFQETIQSRHIPNKLGPINLECTDPMLQPGTRIIANLGILLLKFRFPVEVTEVVENRLVCMEGESRDASMALSIVFNSIQRHRATNVDIDFTVNTLSPPARKAEKLFGPKRSNGLTTGVIQSIFDSVVVSLDQKPRQDKQLRTA